MASEKQISFCKASFGVYQRLFSQGTIKFFSLPNHRLAYRFLLIFVCYLFSNPATVLAQDASRPTMSVGPLEGTIKLDGVLSEADWTTAIG